jgi:ferredoxin-NADP reductase
VVDLPNVVAPDPRTSEARRLKVTAVTLEARGVLGIWLCDPAGRDLPEWSPGAHLDLVLPSGLVRQYSLCGDNGDRKRYMVAVLLDPAGRGGSQEIHSSPLVGREIHVRGPRNRFELEDAPRYLFIAGGIGITPIISMIRTLPSSVDWSLYYGGRTRDSMAFVEEAVDVGRDRTTIVREDVEGLLDLQKIFEQVEPDTLVYACGPPGLLEAVTRCRDEMTVDIDVRVERFTSAVTEASPESSSANSSFVVELRRTGLVLAVPNDRSVLAVVRDVLPGFPYSCQEGFCGSCETRVLEGMPDHRDDLLTPEEQAAGNTMMICVSRALSGRLVLDV